MATTYSYIYEEFLDKITDPDLLLLAEDDQEEVSAVRSIPPIKFPSTLILQRPRSQTYHIHVLSKQQHGVYHKH